MHEKQLFPCKNGRKKLDFVLFLTQMCFFIPKYTDFLPNWLTIWKNISNFVAKIKI